MPDLSDSLTAVRLRNYESIAVCDIEVGSLVILVGPNGAGKSNFLDALRFVADALRAHSPVSLMSAVGFGRSAIAARPLHVVWMSS